MAKYVTVGQIIENKNDNGVYQQLVLNKEFLSDAPNLLKHAYLDKKGARRLSLYKPREGDKTPDFVKYNVVIKIDDET